MAARFWVGGGSSTAWNATSNTNWSLTSGGSNNVAVPGASDDVTFNGVGASANGASVNNALITILSLTFASGYTNTVTVSSQITIAGNFTDNTAHIWAGASNLAISATSTITSGGKTLNIGMIFTGANTKTLSGNWAVSGLFTVNGVTTLNHTTAETLTLSGGLTMSAACSGNAAISLTGGTWSGASVMQNSLTFAGSSTISGGVAYNTGTITWSSGTITVSGSTLTVGAATTFNTNGMSWAAITLSAAETITINSLLTVTGTMTINASLAITFAGTAGFSVATFTCSHTTTTSITFKNGVTYTITTAFNAFTSRTGAILTFTSDDGTLTTALTLNQGSTCNVLASFTRVDASGGRAIWTFNGTLTTTTNIFAITDLSFVTGRVNNVQAVGSY